MFFGVNAHCVPEDFVDDHGDEVWNVEDCDSDLDSEIDSSPSTPRAPPAKAPASLTPSEFVRNQIGTASLRLPTSLPTPAAAVKIRPVPSSSSSLGQQASLQLALHFRKENDSLRGNLVDAQRQAEEANAASDERGNVDFAHLLELAKEFEMDDDNSTTNQADNSPIGAIRLDDDDNDADEKDAEILSLKSQIAAAKTAMTQSSSTKAASVTSLQNPMTNVCGFWISSKSGELHRIGQREDNANCSSKWESWEVVDLVAGLLTLSDTKGYICTAERLRTRTFGESLIWISGDLWTRHATSV